MFAMAQIIAKFAASKFQAMHNVFPILSILFLFSCQTRELNGEDLFEEGKFSEAIDFYSSYLDSNGFDEEILYNRGRAYEEMGNIKAARTDYDLVLERDERHLNSRLSLSRLAYEEGNYSRSLILTGVALDHHESSFEAHFLLARARHQLGYTTAAMEAYNATISLNKNFGEAYLYRGALKATLKIKSACEDFKIAKRLSVEGGEEAVDKFCS